MTLYRVKTLYRDVHRVRWSHGSQDVALRMTDEMVRRGVRFSYEATPNGSHLFSCPRIALPFALVLHPLVGGIGTDATETLSHAYGENHDA